MLESLKEMSFEQAVNALEAQYQSAINYAEKARQAMDTVISMLLSAESAISETPDGDRIGSLAMSAEDFQSDIKKQLERMKNP